jgi:drug/metabolite transporter (DMT)-like permease
MNIKNKILYWFPKILAILLGVFFVVFGEFDDSPGLQGIGLILIIAIIVTVIKSRKKQ